MLTVSVQMSKFLKAELAKEHRGKNDTHILLNLNISVALKGRKILILREVLEFQDPSKWQDFKVQVKVQVGVNLK